MNEALNAIGYLNLSECRTLLQKLKDRIQLLEKREDLARILNVNKVRAIEKELSDAEAWFMKATEQDESSTDEDFGEDEPYQ